MIYIDRSRVPAPKELDPLQNPRIQREQENAQEYFGSLEQNRGQHRFTFKAFRHPNIRSALVNLCNDKCAYCESKMSHAGVLDMEHYRPKSSVLESPDHPGYWWLANDWNNLLLACTNCNRKTRNKDGFSGKANHFPLIDESQRVFTPLESVSLETPLLLNPCTDQPEDHLIYNDNGTVMSSTTRGQATIVVLGLNRIDLVRARHQAILDIESRVDLLLQSSKIVNWLDTDPVRRTLEYLQHMTREEEEFAGLKRQYVRAGLERIDKKMAEQENLRHTKSYTKTQKREIRRGYESFTQQVENISLDDTSDPISTLQERLVERIELKNIRTFENQSFDFIKSQGDSAPWLMLLGENGTGKSTILKSLCMNLCDAQYFKNMVRHELVDPNSFIRRGKRTGTIKVWMTGSPKPRVLEFKKNRVTFTNSGGKSETIILPLDQTSRTTDIWSSPNYLLAYGATRLLPRGSEYEAKHIEGKWSRLDNLFNPFVPLIDAQEWLLSLNETLFRRVAIILKDLLRLSDNEEIKFSKKTVSIPVNGDYVPIKELSDGYQSVIALAADILQLVMNRWSNPDDARGIVLLDEIGAHLHPRWKMRIVNSLRDALPNMQFVASTHQPLCIRGINQGEIVLMRRDPDKMIEVITDLPNPKDLRISQILTSVFGLSTVVDPELEAEYNRYYELRAMNSRSDKEENEMNNLRDALNPDLLLGETRLDNLEYKIVQEKYAHYAKADSQDDIQKLTDETLSAVQSLWDS